MYIKSLQKVKKGFNFDNYQRNKMLMDKKIMKKPQFTTTGTTICGMIFDGGVMLAADTRATQGPIVGDKNCYKIHELAPNIYCCGAGTAADCDFTTTFLQSDLELERLNSGRDTRIATAVTRVTQKLFRYGGNIGAYLIMGGIDSKGPHVVYIHAGGNHSYLPFIAMGSGSLNCIAVLESEYRDGMNAEQAKQLLIKGISAGITHDMGSGSNVDVCCITPGPTVKFERGVKIGASRVQPPIIYDFPIGNTRNLAVTILGECSRKLDKKPKKKVEIVQEAETEMDIEK